MVAWLRRRYGAHPVHLLLMLACLAVGGYALTRVHDQGGLGHIVGWFVLGLIAHDLIGWPLYTWADRLLQRFSVRRPHRTRPAVPWVNHVRVPVFVSGVLLLISFPLVFRLDAAQYQSLVGLSESPYLGHWLLVTGALFAASALFYAVRLGLARRRTGPAASEANSVSEA
jgi:hypothetical protein